MDEDKNINQLEKNDAHNDEQVNYKDKYLKVLADFANFQKQKDQEFANFKKSAQLNLVLKIIDILDDIDIAITNSEEAEKNEILSLLQSKVMNILQFEGIEPIELNPGDQFDPLICEAIGTTEVDDESKKNQVIEIAKKGYLMMPDKKVIRTAKVIVSK